MTTQVSRRWRPRSLLQLVLLAFLVVMLPLGILMFQAGQALSELTRLADDSARQAVEETRRARALSSLAVEMERSARQYAVLEEPGLREIYTQRADEFEAMLARQQLLLPDNADARALASRIDSLKTLLDAPVEDIHTRLDEFVPFAQRTEAVRQATNRHIDARIERIREQAGGVQTRLWVQTTALVSASLLLMLLFTWLIIRPIRQLERRILSLGSADQPAPSKGLQGPAELVQLDERLDWLSARLGELEAQKRQFLRHMSHELKTPLASVREGTALLSDEVAGELTTRQHEILELIEASGEELQRLIEQLLDYNLLQHHAEISVDRFDVTALIRELLAKHQLALDAKGMQVNWRDRPLDWQADRTATGRILDNLLSNAIAYGEDGGLLELRAQQRGDLLLLEVANSGDEIGAEDRKQVFDPFYQGRARRKGPLKGSGIGLSVAADCAKAQQGHLELVDDARLAVCFRLTLPWQACSVQSEHQQDTNTIMMPSPQHRAADADARNS